MMMSPVSAVDSDNIFSLHISLDSVISDAEYIDYNITLCLLQRCQFNTDNENSNDGDVTDDVLNNGTCECTGNQSSFLKL